MAAGLVAVPIDRLGWCWFRSSAAASGRPRQASVAAPAGAEVGRQLLRRARGSVNLPGASLPRARVPHGQRRPERPVSSPLARSHLGRSRHGTSRRTRRSYACALGSACARAGRGRRRCPPSPNTPSPSTVNNTRTPSDAARRVLDEQDVRAKVLHHARVTSRNARQRCLTRGGMPQLHGARDEPRRPRKYRCTGPRDSRRRRYETE